MHMSRTARAALAAATALLLLPPTAAVAKDGGRGGGHGHGHGRDDAPTSYLLGPAEAGIFPEGIAARGDTFYVGSTADGTIYRGDVDEPGTTVFLPGGQDGRTVAVGMKVDGRTLFVAGGNTGKVFAYDVKTRELTGSWQVPEPVTAQNPTFLNDLVVTSRGDVYVTDSFRPFLYRIDRHDRRDRHDRHDRNAVGGDLEVAVRFDDTSLEYVPGEFNVNGIVASRNGKYLVVAHSFAQTLYRISLRDGSVTPIDLGGEDVAGDGLVLDGRTLYAVASGAIVKIELARDPLSGTVVSRTTDPGFVTPTTAALVKDSLLVVNSRFAERDTGASGPFTVTRIPTP
jgi:sugar lactone lactonase YvrE